MALIQCLLARCDKHVESSLAEFQIGESVYCCEQYFLQHGKDVQNATKSRKQ